LDLQSGILHASELKDFKTVFSYFFKVSCHRRFQAFDQYGSVKDLMATNALKYMLLSKVMLNLPQVCFVQSITTGPRHAGPDMESMKAVARSLANFQGLREDLQVQPKDDMIVGKQLATLYSNMLEHNLCRSVSLFVLRGSLCTSFPLQDH